MKMTTSVLGLLCALCIVVSYAQSPPACGRTRYDTKKRIVGGDESRDGEWPWLVSVMVSIYGNPREHVCGATLITPRWALSAAHCFHTPLNDSLSDNPQDYTIRIGAYDIFDEDDDHIDVTPSMIIKHEDYNYPASFLDDIALIKLPNDLQMGDQVNRACLPDENTNYPASCTVAGWGHQQAGGTVSAISRHVTVDLIDNTDCTDIYSNYANELSSWDGLMCAGDTTQGGRDACQSDSGGPLVCHVDNAWVLAGVVSGGDGCGAKEYPGVYTNVQYYLDWIRDRMAENP